MNPDSTGECPGSLDNRTCWEYWLALVVFFVCSRISSEVVSYLVLVPFLLHFISKLMPGIEGFLWLLFASPLPWLQRNARRFGQPACMPDFGWLVPQTHTYTQSESGKILSNLLNGVLVLLALALCASINAPKIKLLNYSPLQHTAVGIVWRKERKRESKRECNAGGFWFVNGLPICKYWLRFDDWLSVFISLIGQKRTIKLWWCCRKLHQNDDIETEL